MNSYHQVDPLLRHSDSAHIHMSAGCVHRVCRDGQHIHMSAECVHRVCRHGQHANVHCVPHLWERKHPEEGACLRPAQGQACSDTAWHECAHTHWGLTGEWECLLIRTLGMKGSHSSGVLDFESALTRPPASGLCCPTTVCWLAPVPSIPTPDCKCTPGARQCCSQLAGRHRCKAMTDRPLCLLLLHVQRLGGIRGP